MARPGRFLSELHEAEPLLSTVGWITAGLGLFSLVLIPFDSREILGLNPTPYLMAEALLSDTGGVATLVGDPPNVLIASAAGFSFNDFLTHSFPLVLIVWLVALVLVRYLFREDLKIQPTDVEAVFRLNPTESLEDWKTARRVLIVLAVAILMFFFQGLLQVSTAYIALSAAAAVLVWVRPNIHEVLRRVEWSVLIFFGALFVMVGALESSGVLESVVSALEHLNQIPQVWFGVLLIWIVAVLSAIVDNVPITIAMIPVIHGLSQHGVEVTALWWALAFGAGFGGNGTIIGSTANIVVATLSERTRYPITSALWNKRGLPVMIVACSVASVLYILAFPWLSR